MLKLYDNLRINNEPYISMNGEVLCDEYLPEGNPVNPESPFGLFLYLVVGGGFDDMDEDNNVFINDMSIMSCSSKRLDRYYGVDLGLPRPYITEGTGERLLTDDEYRVYLYLRNSQLLTRLDLLSVFSHCMGDDTLEDKYNGVTVTDEINTHTTTVDHLHYNSPTDNPASNIGRNSSSDKNIVVNHASTEEGVYTLPSHFSYTGEYVTFVNVPNNGWSKAFLDFLAEFISIKGNVLVREVIH